jgi:PKD repeat protein
MRIKLVLTLIVLAVGLLVSAAATKSASSATTIPYGDLTLNSPWTATNWNDVWDLTNNHDLTLSYKIDMTGITQVVPFLGWWDTPWIEVGIRSEGAANFNPGTFNIYQGSCGGWMVSAVSDLGPEAGPEPKLDLDDTHGLQCSGGRSQLDYDCLNPNTVELTPFGTTVNHGLWFDRDGVDQWQATYWGSLNGQTYNTIGIYQIEITYHAINSGLGSMFAKVNGVQQGFWTGGWKNAQPEKYPAGLSFKGDMSRMQVFAGISGDTSLSNGGNFGSAVLHDITVTGTLGVSSPLVADFSYNPAVVIKGTTVQFTDASHGGSTPYSGWSWDLNGDGLTGDSTAQNPTYVFTAAGDYNVKLTVTGYYACCESASVTKTVHVYATPPVGGEWVPISKIGLVAPSIGLALATTAIAASFVYVNRRKKL